MLKWEIHEYRYLLSSEFIILIWNLNFHTNLPALLMRSLLLILILFLAPVSLPSQALSKLKGRLSAGHYSLQLSYQNGGPFKTNDFVEGINAAGTPIDRYQALSIRLGQQTTGEKTWEQVYNYPRYGIGLYTADYKSRELGQPVSVYGFLAGPFFRIRQFSFNYDFAVGIATNWNVWDPLTNPYNVSVSSHITSYVEILLSAEIRLVPRVFATVGAGLSHSSNGAVTLPNRGLNSYFSKFSLRYDLFAGNPVKPKIAIEKLKGVDEWLLAIYGSYRLAGIPVEVKPTEKLPPIPVYAFGIFTTWHRQLGYRNKLGAGIHLGYNGLPDPQFQHSGDTLLLIRDFDNRRFECSIFASYELMFNKFSVIMEPGIFLPRNGLIAINPTFYQRIGCKYYFTDHIFAAVQIRAHEFHLADIIEWTIGYRM